MSQDNPTFIESVIGEQLSSVEFVQDYVQLHFDGPTLTLFVWPVVSVGELTARFGDSCYRDELCKRIAHNVVEVMTGDPSVIVIRFDDGSAITVSLNPGDRTGPEAGYFRASRDSREPLLEF